MIRRVADSYSSLPRPDSDENLAKIIVDISDGVLKQARRWFPKGERDRLQTALSRRMPLPVLSVCGVDDRETAWTQYFRHMLDDEAPHGLGGLVSRALYESITGERTSSRVFVFGEQDLGEDRAPCGCLHGCRIDLVLLGERYVIAIEQKVRAPLSNWRCNCSEPKTYNQLESYQSVFPGWLRKHHHPGFRSEKPPKVLYRFLTRTGRPAAQNSEGRIKKSDWESVTYQGISEILAIEVFPKVTDQAQRYILTAFLLDMNANALGRWDEVTHEMRRLLKDPDPSPLQLLRLQVLRQEYALLFKITEDFKYERIPDPD